SAGAAPGPAVRVGACWRAAESCRRRRRSTALRVAAGTRASARARARRLAVPGSARARPGFSGTRRGRPGQSAGARPTVDETANLARTDPDPLHTGDADR